LSASSSSSSETFYRDHNTLRLTSKIVQRIYFYIMNVWRENSRNFFSLLCFHALSFDVAVPSALDYIVTIID
jgi:hypothetical protein